MSIRRPCAGDSRPESRGAALLAGTGRFPMRRPRTLSVLVTILSAFVIGSTSTGTQSVRQRGSPSVCRVR